MFGITTQLPFTWKVTKETGAVSMGKWKKYNSVLNNWITVKFPRWRDNRVDVLSISSANDEKSSSLSF